MTQATLVDGLGQVHTRIYAAVADLPTPFLGAMAIVDGGMGGVLYISLHDTSGTLAWIAIADLYDVVQTIATPTNNQITSSDPLAVGLSIVTVAVPLDLQSDGTGLVAVQTGATPTESPIIVRRENLTPGATLLETNPDPTLIVPFVNGSGEITVRTYSTLPAMTSDHLGAIIRVLGGAGVEDKFYLGVLDATSTPIWTQFIGPTGATGTAGVTPQLRESGGYIQVSYDSGVTWSNLVPLTDITGPVGPTGPPGTFGLPGLPASDTSVEFVALVPATGFQLQFLLPTGYSVRVNGWSGIWEVVNASAIPYDVGGDGSPTDNDPSRGKPYGELLYVTAQIDSHGIPLSITDAARYDVLFTAPADDTLYKLFANNDADGVEDGYLLVDITVFGSTAGWHAHIDFTTTDGGFVPFAAGFGTHGSDGWDSACFLSGDWYNGMFIQLVLDSCTMTKVEFLGELTIGGGVNYPGDGERGVYFDTSFVAFAADRGSDLSSGAQDFDWDGVVAHHWNLASPQTGKTLVGLYLNSWDSNSNACLGSSRITSVDIYGTGVNPSQLTPYLV